MPKLKAYILCPFAGKSSIYTGWVNSCPIPCEIVDTHPGDWRVPDDAGIAITHMHYRWEEVSKLRKLVQRSRVPVLILADGILEYRNTWEHPDLPDGAIFQPLIGHKLACIGRGQARTVEAWGNAGKCEVVGLPRLDDISRDASPVRREGRLRLLIATANTPAFNDEQRESVIESLTHIRKRIDHNPRTSGRKMEVIWRLTDGLEQQIGAPVDGNPDSRPPLSEVISNVDAVITTPSTLYLESLLKKRPTAMLDFHNNPQYVTPAWTINAPKHLNWVLEELANPPAAKMLFQEIVLKDQLQLDRPARERMAELISVMTQAGVEARKNDRDLVLPPRILNDPTHGFAEVPPGFDMQTLYPDNPVFPNRDVEMLQAELVQAIARMDMLPVELAEKSAHLASVIKALDGARARAALMKVNAIESQKQLKRVKNRLDKLKARIAKRREQRAEKNTGASQPEDSKSKDSTPESIKSENLKSEKTVSGDSVPANEGAENSNPGIAKPARTNSADVAGRQTTNPETPAGGQEPE